MLATRRERKPKTFYLTRHAWKRFYQILRVTLMCHTQVNSVNVTHDSENTTANRRAANIKLNCKVLYFDSFQTTMAKDSWYNFLCHYRITWHVNLTGDFQVNFHGISSLKHRSIIDKILFQTGVPFARSMVWQS